MGGFFKGSEGKSVTKTKPMYAAQTMPDWMVKSAEQAARGMHPSWNIGFGGQNIPIASQQFKNAAWPWIPMGTTSESKTTQGSMSPFASMLTAAMPFLPYQNMFPGNPTGMTAEGSVGANTYPTIPSWISPFM